MGSTILSVRLKPATLEKLEAQARERGEPKTRLVQRLVEEGLRMEAHPGIVFRDGPAGRRAALSGGPDVWEIVPVIMNEGGGEEGVAGAAEYFGRPVQDMRKVACYYREYRDEIDDWIRRNSELAERLEAEWLREQELIRR